MNDEDAYSQVAAELAANDLKVGLMTKAIADSVGNENVAKSLYIKFRAQQLLAEHKIANERKQQQEHHARIVAVKKRTTSVFRKFFLVIFMIASVLLALSFGISGLFAVFDKSGGMYWVGGIVMLFFAFFFGAVTFAFARALLKNDAT